MLPATLDASLGLLNDFEGGFSDNVYDPGGRTLWGVTEATYRFWKKDPDANVEHMSKEEMALVYKELYWDACRCSELPYLFRYVVFDMAVNMGTKRSIRILQRTLGVTEDGIIGAETLNKAQSVYLSSEYKKAALLICDKRAAYYTGLVSNNSSYSVFLNGWLNRNEKIKKLIMGAPSFTPPIS